MRSRAQHAGLSLLVPTIGSNVLINSKEDAFDLPVLVLDEVQTLSAVCGRHYRVSLPMRRARAFPHESKTFGERERELRTRRWRGGCLTNSTIDRRVATYASDDAVRRARAHGNSELPAPRRASTAEPCVTWDNPT